MGWLSRREIHLDLFGRQDLSLKDVESRKQMMVQSESNNSELPLEYLESDGVWVLSSVFCVVLDAVCMCTEELLKVDGGKAVPLCFQEAHLSSASPHLRHSPSFSLSVHTVGQEGSKMFKDVQSIVIYHDIMHVCSRCAKKSYCTVTQQKTYLVANSQVLNGDLIMNQMVMNAMNGCDMSLNFNAHWSHHNDWQRLATTGKCTTRSITKATNPSHWICLQHANRIAQGKELCNGVQYLQCHYGRTSLYCTLLQLQLQ